jgi:Carboxypeptidase regulatory-like domain
VMTALLFSLSFAVTEPQVSSLPPPPRADMAQPPRDPGRRQPPEPAGTAVVRGRVVAADTGNPIRRATVNLSMMPPPAPSTTAPAGAPGAALVRTVTQTVVINGVATTTSAGGIARPKTITTDSQGAFEFKGLPAGTYRLTASPGPYSAAYLPMSYGAKKPSGPGSSDPGTPFDVADGQVFDKATIRLTRGAVIAGRVTDENGDPMARVQVYSIMYLPGSTRGMRNGSGSSTDDLGQFRLFALVPGDYIVAAEARGNTFVPPNAAPETEEDRIGFVTTFFPNTADETSAQRVRARSGGETPGVEIRMVSGRLFHISGMVTDSQGRIAVRGNGSLMRRGPSTAVTSSFGFSTDEQGRFQMRNIPPGNYRLTVRQQMMPPPRNADGSMPDQGEFATMPISVNGDLDDMLITTSPGATITGTVVFENGPPQAPQTSFTMRVNPIFADPESMSGAPYPAPGVVGPDLNFTMKGLSTELMLRSNAPDNTLKAVLLGAGEDITDTPHEFKTGERVTLVMTSRIATVEGTVTDDVGKPVTDAALMLFADDKTAWRATSIRTRRAGTDPTGHYRLTGVLPGRYFLVAMPRDRSNALAPFSDPAAFEALAKEATTVVVGEGEQRQVDVKVSAGGGQ